MKSAPALVLDSPAMPQSAIAYDGEFILSGYFLSKLYIVKTLNYLCMKRVPFSRLVFFGYRAYNFLYYPVIKEKKRRKVQRCSRKPLTRLLHP